MLTLWHLLAVQNKWRSKILQNNTNSYHNIITYRAEHIMTIISIRFYKKNQVSLKVWLRQYIRLNFFLSRPVNLKVSHSYKWFETERKVWIQSREFIQSRVPVVLGCLFVYSYNYSLKTKHKLWWTFLTLPWKRSIYQHSHFPAMKHFRLPFNPNSNRTVLQHTILHPHTIFYFIRHHKTWCCCHENSTGRDICEDSTRIIHRAQYLIATVQKI